MYITPWNKWLYLTVFVMFCSCNIFHVQISILATIFYLPHSVVRGKLMFSPMCDSVHRAEGRGHTSCLGSSCQGTGGKSEREGQGRRGQGTSYLGPVMWSGCRWGWYSNQVTNPLHSLVKSDLDRGEEGGYPKYVTPPPSAMLAWYGQRRGRCWLVM